MGDSYDGILSDFVKNGRFGTETAVRAGIRMLADYEVKMRSLRNDMQAADAEIKAGLGKRYLNGTDLFNDVMNEGKEAVLRYIAPYSSQVFQSKRRDDQFFRVNRPLDSRVQMMKVS